MKLAYLALAAATVLAPAVMLAQTGATIADRKVNQQDRIAQGVNSGQLTARETSHLEHQEAGINKEEAGMRAQDNGHLTAQDKKTLTKQQNAESRRIYRDKHNARVRK
jgi:hypothetical protein